MRVKITEPVKAKATSSLVEAKPKSKMAMMNFSF